VSSLAERYEAGDCEAVWDRIADLGEAAASPQWRADVEAVADLTMARVAGNVATIVVRLTLMGYRFGHRYSRNRRFRTIEDLNLRRSMESAGRDMGWLDEGEVEETVMGWPGPAPDIDDRVSNAETLLGCPLPAALRSLYQHVGEVDLAGSFVEWDPSAFNFDDDLDWPPFGRFTDPFNLLPVDCIGEHVDPATGDLDLTHLSARGQLTVPIANGRELSANQIGDTKHVLLPMLGIEAGADPVVYGMAGNPGTPGTPGVRLVAYLREAFVWGGFPGLAHADLPVPAEVERLRTGLLPI